MISEKDIIADLHTHTIFSKHAYSTVTENIEVAKQKGLKYLGITDHYFGNGDELDKKNEVNRIKYLEERVNSSDLGINVIGSAEFNLFQEVFDYKKLETLKWKPIGLHNWFVETDSLTLDALFEEFKLRAECYGVNAFVHIERELHKINHKVYGATLSQDIKMFLSTLVELAKKRDICLEVNESTLVPKEMGSDKRLEFWLRYAKEHRNFIYLGTDAHYCNEVGCFERVISLLNAVDYPKELIMNCNIDLLKTFVV